MLSNGCTPRTSFSRCPSPPRAPSRNQRTTEPSSPTTAHSVAALASSPHTSCCGVPPPPRTPSRSQRTTASHHPSTAQRLEALGGSPCTSCCGRPCKFRICVVRAWIRASVMRYIWEDYDQRYACLRRKLCPNNPRAGALWVAPARLSDPCHAGAHHNGAASR